MSVYGPDYHFQGNGWTLADVTSFSCILQSVFNDVALPLFIAI